MPKYDIMSLLRVSLAAVLVTLSVPLSVQAQANDRVATRHVHVSPIVKIGGVRWDSNGPMQAFSAGLQLEISKGSVVTALGVEAWSLEQDCLLDLSGRCMPPSSRSVAATVAAQWRSQFIRPHWFTPFIGGSASVYRWDQTGYTAGAGLHGGTELGSVDGLAARTAAEIRYLATGAWIWQVMLGLRIPIPL
jgi:hypothetical protein